MENNIKKYISSKYQREDRADPTSRNRSISSTSNDVCRKMLVDLCVCVIDTSWGGNSHKEGMGSIVVFPYNIAVT